MQFSNSWQKQLALYVMISITGMLTFPSHAQVSGENPWAGSSRPLIDEKQSATDSNSWRAKDKTGSEDGYDESKYPPLDENTALGTEYSVSPSVSPSAYAVTERAWPDDNRAGGYYTPQIPNYEQMPVYPDNYRRDYSAYDNRPLPTYRQNYLPEYPARYGSGSNSRGGFPFFGNSDGGFPFSMGDGFMPFSGQGFW